MNSQILVNDLFLHYGGEIALKLMIEQVRVLDDGEDYIKVLIRDLQTALDNYRGRDLRPAIDCQVLQQKNFSLCCKKNRNIMGIKTADVVAFLNDALLLDKAATHNLFDFYVPCNDNMAGDPTIQVREVAGNNLVGMLGFINGVLGRHGQPLIMSIKDSDTGELHRFDIFADSQVPYAEEV